MAFIAWPEIEGFHHIRKFLRVDPGQWWQYKQQFGGTSIVQYKCKVKLHGTNAAVQILANGNVVCQSRESILSPEKDNAGFARWVKEYEPNWRNVKGPNGEPVILYGEWIGPGIQKGVAVNQIPKKSFAVFAARPLLEDGTPEPDILWVEPSILEEIMVGVPDTYVLPWYDDKSVSVDWRKTDEEISQAIAPINDWVAAIEANDPWVEATFNVKGTGEGLVFYPVSLPHVGFESFVNLCFKAKGEKHKNIKTAAPAQVNPETAASVGAFVELVLTPARLEQGATAVGGFDLKLTGKFVNWCTTDVQKETTDELEASGLDWKQVQKPLTDKARSWYIEQAKMR